MRTFDERHASISQAGDELEVPERHRPVERLHEHLLGEPEQRLLIAGRAEPDDIHVVRDVEVLVVHPDRPPDPERDCCDPLAQPRQQTEPRLDPRPDLVQTELSVLVEQRPAFEDRK